MANLFKVKDRVALKENNKYIGVITQISPPYTKDDPLFYYVQWDKTGTAYLYMEDDLIKESDIKTEQKTMFQKIKQVLTG